MEESGQEVRVRCGGVILLRRQGGPHPFFHKTGTEIFWADVGGLSGAVLRRQDWSADRHARVDYHSLLFPQPELEADEDKGTPTLCRLFAKTEMGKCAYPSPWAH